MNKIPTIFERDWRGGVVDKYVVDPSILGECIATQKMDGTNVRVTIKGGKLISYDKRKNPDKMQKKQGIQPWYIAASRNDPVDKHIYKAVDNTDVSILSDGKWSGEAIGPKIQGNPLHLEQARIILFSLAPVIENVPLSFIELKLWLPQQRSTIGVGLIEGIVWHHADGRMFKIKAKDFK